MKRSLFRSSKKRLLSLLAVLSACLLAAIVWLISWSNTPSETAIHIGGSDTPASATLPAYQRIRSKFFSSDLPAQWVVRSSGDSATHTQLVSFPSGKSLADGQVAIIIDTLPADGLQGVPDYNLRIKDRAHYHQQASDMPGVTAIFSDGAGYTAFLRHDQHYAIVTVSQFTTPDQAYSLLSHVISAWKWST